MVTWFCVTECFHPASLGGSSRLFKVGESYEAQPNENLEPHFVRRLVEHPKTTPAQLKVHPAYRHPKKERAMPASEFFKTVDKANIKKVTLKHVGFGRYDVLVNGSAINKSTLTKEEAEQLLSQQ